MCGIAGYLGVPATWGNAAAVVEAMCQRMAHRGPDDSGTWIDDGACLALGHRRLAIVDLSPQGHQPMVSHCGRYVLTYNGEIYNHLELRKSLGLHPWRGHSDTETLLACFGRFGVQQSLPKLTGMFAFAVWDREQRTLTLARDRMGEKPLYYGTLGSGEFVFASELKALRAHPRWVGEIDREALTLFLRHNCIPAPWSVYRGVSKLRPGEWLAVKANGQIERGTYWSTTDVAKESEVRRRDALPDSQAIDELDGLLGRVIYGQMLSDVPLGAFLSGGVDSSTIAAQMVRQSSSKIRTFSIGFDEAGYNEAEHAKAVAEHLGTDHTELYVTAGDALAVVPKLPMIFDEPFADASQIPTYLLAAMTREKVTVALSGDGGDELFSGYSRYRLAHDVWHQLNRFPLGLRRWAADRLLALQPGSLDAVARSLMKLVPRRRKIGNVGDKLHKFAANVLPADSAAGMYRSLISHWQNPASLVHGSSEPHTLVQQTADQNVSLGEVELMCLIDQLTYLPDDILVKVDRAAMAVSLETRVPLLDHRLVEFAWQTPMHQKIRDGQSKWLLRQVLYRYVPRKLIERPKQGFAVPLDLWLRGPLRDWAEALLEPRRLSREGYFNVDEVQQKWDEHQAGSRNWQYLLWDVLMFQAWLEESDRAPVAACAA
jgi:asparagine synthase (glutamine-hydrolysing)